MDIKKFITNNDFSNDYNKLIQDELKAINFKTYENSCIYKLNELSFFDIQINNDEIIKDFEENYIIPEIKLVYGGSMIKKYLNPNKNYDKIKKHYFVYVITEINIKDIFLKQPIIQNNLYVIQIKDTIFYINRNKYLNLTQCILTQQKELDRIVMFENNLYASGIFILEYYKTISFYSPTDVDPYFNTPIDVLDIYEKNNNIKKNSQEIIEKVYTNKINEIKHNEMINYNSQKYTILEFIIIKIMETSNELIIEKMFEIYNYFEKYEYFRPAFFVAKMVKFDEKYKDNYEKLIKNNACNDIFYEENQNLISINHIDMFILNKLIIKNNEKKFMDYIKKTNILSKFKTISKTSNKIIEWLYLYNPIEIIDSLITVQEKYSYNYYKIIFMTQELKYLGNDFLNKYISENNELDEEQQNIIFSLLQICIDNNLTKSFQVILKLCKNKINLNELYFLCNDEKSIDILNIIIKKNINNINTKNEDGDTPLIYYSKKDLNLFITTLLEIKEVNYETVNNDNNNFLHILCQNNNYDCVKIIIKKVMNIIDNKNNLFMTPAIIATYNGYEELFYILKCNGCNLDEYDTYGNTIYHYICKNNICIGMCIQNIKNKYGLTPFDYCHLNPEFYYFE